MSSSLYLRNHRGPKHRVFTKSLLSANKKLQMWSSTLLGVIDQLQTAVTCSSIFAKNSQAVLIRLHCSDTEGNMRISLPIRSEGAMVMKEMIPEDVPLTLTSQVVLIEGC